MLSFLGIQTVYIMVMNLKSIRTIMRITIEKAIIGSITLLLVIYAFTEFSAHPDIILYRLSELLVFVLSFFFMAFRWTGDPNNKWNRKKRWSLMALLWVSGWFLLSLTKIVKDLLPENDPILLKYFFLPSVADNVLVPIVPGLIIGIIYGTIRYAVLTKNYKKIKILCGLTGAGVILYSVILIWKLSYTGSESIQFLDRNQEMLSLEEVLSQPELQGKKVYVDFWYATCSPCIKAFKNMKPGKELLKEQDYVTLFMGRETSHPDSKVRWISTISDYELEGYHVYMSEQLEEEIFNLLMKYEDLYLAYPHYFIVDENGNITDWDAPGITEVTALEESLNKTIASKNN
ncbi:hypothetical protein G3570_00285 [Balneolaceae bacterium YR4-1]|uniref:Thioredoxin domain-containing protein n=1 Tax=Halalkalibaculum roseum TaxID=2709311 RepID=A0A6M1SI69_9BACT|nr:redoxin family protein [Halalkalibaculum roseum]NGP75051.1 hypothetical protein [Halalkalibaculum roseum]